MGPAWQPTAVVFLDVDGVLHSLYGEEIFRESCCRLLQQLLLATGAAIVLSSSWREDPGKVALLNEMLRSRRLLPVHDCTRVLNGPREEEICEWLRRHPEVRRWVAIDDLDLQSRGTENAKLMRGHFVQTCKHIGLTSRDVELAKGLLLRNMECTPGVGAALASPRLKLQKTVGSISPRYTLLKRTEISISPERRSLGQLQQRRPTSRARPVTSSPQRQPLQPLQTVSVGPGDLACCRLSNAAPRSPSCTSDLTSRQLHKRPMPPAVPRLPALGCAAFGDNVLAALVCSESSTVDLDQLSVEQRTIALRQGGSPWSVGWGLNGSLFARLVPDGELRACISRQHLELEWDPPLLLWLRPTSAAPVLINGVPMVERAVNVAHGMHISFCGGTRNETFLTFTAILRNGSLSAAGWPSSDVWTQLPLQKENLGEQVMQQQAEQPSQLLEHVLGVPQVEVSSPLATAPHLSRAARAAGAGAAAAAEQDAEAVVHIEAEPAASAAVSFITTERAPSVQMLCSFSMAMDVTLLPESARSIALPACGSLFVGRSHQPDLFEALLGGSHALQSCVSRAHLSLTLSHERPGSIEISNLSVSAVRLSGSIIEHGETATVEAPAEVNLLTYAPGTSPPAVETLLTFTLGLCQPEHPFPQALRQVQPETPQTEEETVIEVPRALVRETVVEIPEKPDFCLELGGTAIHAGLPVEARRVLLPQWGRELVIGRSFQAQFLLEAIHQDSLPWVSRAHFRLESSVAGTHCLVLLSNHPMWLLRHDCRERVRRGHKIVIQRGDLILLYTGASDGTADGVDGFGTLHWTCVPL